MNDKALAYAERYGIIEYKVKGDTMIYYTSYSVGERVTYKVMVNLITNTEVNRTSLKRYYKKGEVNAYL